MQHSSLAEKHRFLPFWLSFSSRLFAHFPVRLSQAITPHELFRKPFARCDRRSPACRTARRTMVRARDIIIRPEPASHDAVWAFSGANERARVNPRPCTRFRSPVLTDEIHPHRDPSHTQVVLAASVVTKGGKGKLITHFSVVLNVATCPTRVLRSTSPREKSLMLTRSISSPIIKHSLGVAAVRPHDAHQDRGPFSCVPKVSRHG